MHTLKIIAGGFLLLGIFLLAGRYLARVSTATAAKGFIPVWFLLAGVNMWVGVARDGYSGGDEAPIFLLNFLAVAAVAGLLVWRG